MPTDRSGPAALRISALQWTSRGAATARRAAVGLASIPLWAFLSLLIAAEWTVVGSVAAVAQHNGWMYHGGGDQSWYYTSAWVLGHGHIPQSSVGYGYSFLIAPIARLAGPNLLAGLPFVVLFNVVVLWPIALLCLYGLAKAIGGRGFAYAAALVWTVLPLLAIPYFRQSYHSRYIDVQLPSSLGLTSLADFPSMVFLLVAAYFAVKAIAQRSGPDALVGGAAAGFAAAVKPANLIFLPAAFAALLAARRSREAQMLALGLVPALTGLAIWKYVGLGYLPAFSSHPAAPASEAVLSGAALGGLNVHAYLPLDWSHLRVNIDYIREFTWSPALLMWIILAGVLALARRSAALVVLAVGWLGAYVVLKGSSLVVTVSGGNFFRYMTPAYPAFFLLCASLPLLVPVLGRRLAERGRVATWPDGRRTRVAVLALAGVLSLLPIAMFTLEHPLTAPAATRLTDVDQYFPANQFPLVASVERGTVSLSWPSQARSGAQPVYGVIRESNGGIACTPVPHAAATCAYRDSPFAKTKSTTWRDRPPAGRWTYRIVVTISATDAPDLGDFVVLSRPATVDVARR
jgi:hypothetical protein